MKKEYKRQFVDFMIECEVLKFGDFATKSGRRTPFFINTGNYNTGARMARLGDFYARALTSALGCEFDCLFGPAYKGIPLVTTTSISLARDYGIEAKLCFNRKELKDHGEGGGLIGYHPRDGDRVVIVEDVTTAGTSVRETVPLLQGLASVEIVALLVAVDRQERGAGDKSALQELNEQFGLLPIPIVTLDEIIEHLACVPGAGQSLLDPPLLARINDYRQRYGTRPVVMDK